MTAKIVLSLKYPSRHPTKEISQYLLLEIKQGRICQLKFLHINAMKRKRKTRISFSFKYFTNIIVK